MRAQDFYKIRFQGLLGGSRAVKRGVISPLIWVISIVSLLITLFITTHDPRSSVQGSGVWECAYRVLGARLKGQSTIRASEHMGPDYETLNNLLVQHFGERKVHLWEYTGVIILGIMAPRKAKIYLLYY